MTNEEVKALEAKHAAEKSRADAAETELARMREAAVLKDTRAIVITTLAGLTLPEQTRTRLTESLSAKPILKEGVLDVQALKVAVAEAAKAEIKYLAEATGAGRVTGMGAGEADLDEAERVNVNKTLVESFVAMGYSKESAEAMAKGR